MLFLKTAVAAFPRSCQDLAESAAKTLMPLVDQGYQSGPPKVVAIHGETVRIPQRIHFIGSSEPRIRNSVSDYVDCLRTRSTDGHIRQEALRQALKIGEPWAVPFVVLLGSEYVIEIIQDIVLSIPALRGDLYGRFAHENRPLMRVLRARSISYWNCYYRRAFPERGAYPGMVLLNQLDVWAAEQAEVD